MAFTDAHTRGEEQVVTNPSGTVVCDRTTSFLHIEGTGSAFTVVLPKRSEGRPGFECWVVNRSDSTATIEAARDGTNVTVTTVAANGVKLFLITASVRGSLEDTWRVLKSGTIAATGQAVTLGGTISPDTSRRGALTVEEQTCPAVFVLTRCDNGESLYAEGNALEPYVGQYVYVSSTTYTGCGFVDVWQGDEPAVVETITPQEAVDDCDDPACDPDPTCDVTTATSATVSLVGTLTTVATGDCDGLAQSFGDQFIVEVTFNGVPDPKGVCPLPSSQHGTYVTANGQPDYFFLGTGRMRMYNRFSGLPTFDTTLPMMGMQVYADGTTFFDFGVVYDGVADENQHTLHVLSAYTGISTTGIGTCSSSDSQYLDFGRFLETGLYASVYFEGSLSPWDYCYTAMFTHLYDDVDDYVTMTTGGDPNPPHSPSTGATDSGLSVSIPSRDATQDSGPFVCGDGSLKLQYGVTFSIGYGCG